MRFDCICYTESMKRFLITISIIIILGFSAFLSIKSEKIKFSNVFSILSDKQVHLGFVGDMMFDRLVKSSVARNGGDYNFLFTNIKGDLKKYDFLFGNLEGPVSDLGKNVGSKYSFRMDPEILPVLKNVGFKAVSVANNHIGDWGHKAMADTFSRLQTVGIEPVGGGASSSPAYRPRYFDVGGLKIAIIGASEFGKGYTEATEKTAGIAVIDKKKLASSTKEALSKSDFVIVSLHFGTEYAPEPNDYQKDVAEFLIDSGANLVVGHHPHVLEPLVSHKGGYIAYSLGNFIFDQDFSSTTMSSAILDLIIANKKIISIKLIPIQLNSNFQPAVRK